MKSEDKALKNNFGLFDFFRTKQGWIYFTFNNSSVSSRSELYHSCAFSECCCCKYPIFDIL